MMRYFSEVAPLIIAYIGGITIGFWIGRGVSNDEEDEDEDERD